MTTTFTNPCELWRQGIPYTGPRYIDGRIPLGPCDDGGEAEYVAVDGVRCCHGLATGEAGSGKTAFLETVALGLKSSGVWKVCFTDGDQVGSSPLLTQVADWTAAGPEQVMGQLEVLEALLNVRSPLGEILTPGPDADLGREQLPRRMRPIWDYPALTWIIDALHRLTSDPWLIERGFVKRLERLARLGPSYGVVMLAATDSLLVSDFGNSTLLRSYLAGRNLIAFRSCNRSERAIASGLGISPSTLPPGGGYAYVAGAGRPVMTRVAWARDLSSFAVGLPDTPLDPGTASALAPFWRATSRDPATI